MHQEEIKTSQRCLVKIYQPLYVYNIWYMYLLATVWEFFFCCSLDYEYSDKRSSRFTSNSNHCSVHVCVRAKSVNDGFLRLCGATYSSQYAWITVVITHIKLRRSMSHI